MREDARGLRRVGAAFAARAQMSDQPLDRGILSDEEPAPPPGDQVDMGVALHNGGRLASSDAKRRQAVKSGVGEPVRDPRIDAIPGRHQHRQESPAKSPRELAAAFFQLGDDVFDRPMVTQLPVALARWRVIAMRVAVLEDRRSRGVLHPIDETVFDERGDDGERDRNSRSRRNFEESPERRRITTRVVVAAP